ncbi:bZIP transcription factor 44-like [Zingiber officinale]|nr:bZIP transcription factor 44-like [Zingiber officinale]
MSGSEMEERQRKRKLSNRESARRSRMRKQQHLQDLANQVAHLTKDNAEIVAQVEALSQHHQRLEAENGDLREQAERLERRMQSLSAVLRLAEDLGGVAMDEQGMLQRRREAFPSMGDDGGWFV